MPPYLIFVANAIGFIVAAPLTHTLENRFGRHRSYTLSVTLAIIGYAMIACHPPFLMVVVSFFLLELGMMLSIALNNVSCARLPNATTALGCDLGTYGIGGVVSVAILGVLPLFNRCVCQAITPEDLDCRLEFYWCFG